MPASDLLASSVALKLFAVLRFVDARRPTDDEVADHLNWMFSLEEEGKLFLSGPMVKTGEGAPSGLSILRAGSEEEVKEIMADDPFVKAGLIHWTSHQWTAYEGSLSVRIRLSSSTVETW